jgi:hypothetical protein
MKKFHAIAAVLAALLALSCQLNVGGGGNDDDNNNNNNNPSGVDFESHNTDYSILVRNNTNEKLVAFKGDLVADKLIGGIPAHANGHGLPKSTALFDKTEDFPMILLTEAQYIANKNNLQSQKNTPFTRVYVFYNTNGDNTAVYEIAGGLGGSNSLHIINASTTMNVELRVDGVAGETIGYAPAGILDTTLKLIDGNYNLFPVFKRYNKLRDTVETVYPKGNGSNYAWFHSVSFGEGTETDTINLKNVLQNVSITSGTAMVYVINQGTGGGIRFVEGSYVHATASGLTNIMSGNPRYFQIDMPKMPGTQKYADSIVAGNWEFGATGFEVGLRETVDGEPGVNITIERDKMYTITVTGSHNDGNLKAWISDITSIDSSDFAW